MVKDKPPISFRFYGALNDFLPPHRRHRAFAHVIQQRRSIKDAIESIGVPHPEIDLIVVGDRSVDFSYRPEPGDRIAVYPLFRDLDIRPLTLVRPPALEVPRFVLDAHLGRLTAYLRLAGFDCLYSNRWEDGHLATTSGSEKRVLLSRDVALLKRSVVQYAYWVRNTEPRRQLAEVADRFALARHAQPFSRCAHCNTLLEPVSKDAIVGRLPPRTRELFTEFRTCPTCERIYWKGGHYERMFRVIQELVVGSRQ